MLLATVLLAVLALTVQGERQFVGRGYDKRCSRWTTSSAVLALRSMDDLNGCVGRAAIERRGFHMRACCLVSAATRSESDFPTACGKQQYQPIRKRIVGGSEAARNSWPWQVYIEVGNNICGGSLIDTSYVLTAAHCIDNPNDLAKYKVFVGTHNINDIDDKKDTIAVDKIFVHEDYNSKTMINDIAIIRLSQPVTISDKVNVICLPGPEADRTDQTVWVVGWGAIASGGKTSEVLKQVALHPMPGVCEKDEEYDNQKQICAGADVAGQDSCQGDSGGPLMFESDETWYLDGIVSYGDGCALKGSPATYTRVKYYLPWIQNIIGV